MLSFKSGTPIATINGEKDNRVYIKPCKDEDQAELDTTMENKINIFKEHLKQNKKLSMKDIRMLVDKFKEGHKEIEETTRGLDRIYDEAMEYVNNSLKKYLSFPEDVNLFPVVNTDNFRLAVFGNSGSGKSYMINQFVKANKKKGQSILMFSPFEHDVSFKDLKNLIYVDIEEMEEELEREFGIDDIPKSSICIFDDIQSSRNKKLVKKLETLRDHCYEIGRHSEYNISTISITHNVMMGNASKVLLRESTHYIVFPRANVRDTTKLLMTYANFDAKMIKELLAQESRWAYISKAVPQYWICQHSVRLY